ncbi:MAG TPA: sensor histidine kinase [Archangium sp.]|uniref:sensor histidine kinase n=1 Tax=Archangium sp. TaxID=1872627 RepID=UPI002EDB8781
MSAVALASWPRQMMNMSGEGPSHLTPAVTLDGTDVENIDLHELARHAVALLQATGHVKPSELELALPSEPVSARVSRRRLEQVLFQLLAHAVAAQRGEASSTRAVRLEVEPQDDFGDHGPAFRVRYADPCAEPMPEAGLAMVSERARALGGRLGVRRHGRTGLTVTVELPDQGTASW